MFIELSRARHMKGSTEQANRHLQVVKSVQQRKFRRGLPWRLRECAQHHLGRTLFKTDLWLCFLVAQWLKSLPARAGDMGSVPDPGRTPHAAEQLSLAATAAEPVALERMLRR